MCSLSKIRSRASETVAFNGGTVPPAADFTVPLAVMLQRSDPKQHDFFRLLNPEKQAHTAAIERLQPYDPDKKAGTNFGRPSSVGRAIAEVLRILKANAR